MHVLLLNRERKENSSSAAAATLIYAKKKDHFEQSKNDLPKVDDADWCIIIITKGDGKERD